YAGLLASLRRLVTRLERAGDLAGCDPFVAAVVGVCPESRIAAGYLEARRKLKVLVSAATGHFRELPESPQGWFAHVSRLIKLVERAHTLAGMFQDPTPRQPLGSDFVPLEKDGNVVDLINVCYYCLRGSTIYHDFITAVSHDALQSRSDAARFVTRWGAVPGPLRVLEVGVGGGQYAFDFMACCREHLPDFPRLRYVLGDISAAMLKDALERLEPFRDQIQVLELDRLPEAAPYHLQRHNELLTDLPRCAVLYVDPQGRVYRSLVRGNVPDFLLKDRTALELGQQLERVDLPALRTFGVDTLSHVDWEVRLEPCEGMPYQDLLPALLGDRRDALFSYQVGAADFLVEAIEQRAGTDGAIRLVDYGLSDLGQAAFTYADAIQVVRRYGASATRDLLFPLMARVAERHGCRARILRLEEFIHEALGERAVLARWLAGVEGANRVTPVTSGPTAPAPLEMLERWSDIRTLAERGGTYEDFAAELSSRGWVRLDLPPCPWPDVEGNLERLALDLDFDVNSRLRPLCLGQLQDNRAWIRGRELEIAADRLAEVGFHRGQVLDSLRNPRFSKFWVLEVER
ncbi:MAG: SAM-dependent methyltransferase, partial [Candidatus Eremiobacterota bacterium]